MQRGIHISLNRALVPSRYGNGRYLKNYEFTLQMIWENEGPENAECGYGILRPT